MPLIVNALGEQLTKSTNNIQKNKSTIKQTYQHCHNWGKRHPWETTQLLGSGCHLPQTVGTTARRLKTAPICRRRTRHSKSPTEPCWLLPAEYQLVLCICALKTCVLVPQNQYCGMLYHTDVVLQHKVDVHPYVSVTLCLDLPSTWTQATQQKFTNKLTQ